MQADMERRQAFIDLLSLPDSSDLHRGHRQTIEGRSDRHRIVPYLASAFVQARLLELHERETDRAEASSLWALHMSSVVAPTSTTRRRVSRILQSGLDRLHRLRGEALSRDFWHSLLPAPVVVRFRTALVDRRP